MMQVRLLNFGTVPFLRSQTIFHGIAHAMTPETPDTITLLSPRECYVCIGYHQDLEKEVDVDYCRESGIPVTRREVGGGAVYLDGGQVFYHWIFHREHLPRDVAEIFARYASTLVGTYQALGIAASYRPVNDIQVGARKIGGTGAATIGGALVVAGSLMFDFNAALMARVLIVPSEKFRDKVFQGLQDYMTTMRRELGEVPDRQTVIDLLISQCREVLGVEIVPGELTVEENAAIAGLDERFQSHAWLYDGSGRRRSEVRIKEGVRVAETSHKAAGGLIRVMARVSDGVLEDVSLTGDFFVEPRDVVGELEAALCGLPLDEVRLNDAIEAIYRRYAVQSPGVAVTDWVRALMLTVA